MTGRDSSICSRTAKLTLLDTLNKKCQILGAEENLEKWFPTLVPYESHGGWGEEEGELLQCWVLGHHLHQFGFNWPSRELSHCFLKCPRQALKSDGFLGSIPSYFQIS